MRSKYLGVSKQFYDEESKPIEFFKNLTIFNRRLVMVHELSLNELNGQRRLP